MKNLKILFSVLLLMLFSFNYTVSAASTPPALNSEGVVLMDGDTGQILYCKNPDKTYFPASTTKVLTALVVLENANLDDKVTVGQNPPGADGTSIGIRAGEVFTVRELLAALLLMSGNDCAQALAEHVSGSTAEFAKLMNEKAKELGCTNSNFMNPSGLPDEKHVTTPKDLALIMKACIQNPDFVEIDRIPSLKLSPSTIDGNVIEIANHNYPLFNNSSYYYPYSVASKKGYTEAAKFTNIISAKKGDTTLVASFLKGPDINTVFKDVADIFNYGFANFERTTLYTKDQEVTTCNVGEDSIPLVVSKDVYYTVNPSEKSSLKPTLKYNIPSDLEEKSFKKGEKIATADVVLNGQTIQTIDLLSNADREKRVEEVISPDNSDKYSKYLFGSAIALAILALLRIEYVRRKRIKRKKIKRAKYKKMHAIRKQKAGY